jgi:hypothetical protein
MWEENWDKQGRIQDFKLGGALKKIAPSGGGARKFLGYFVWKITILRQKIIFFPILGGGGVRAGCAPPPGSAPDKYQQDYDQQRKTNLKFIII